MTGFKIKLKNVRFKDGRIYTKEPYTSVSDKLKRKNSRKVRVAKKATATS